MLDGVTSYDVEVTSRTEDEDDVEVIAETRHYDMFVDSLWRSSSEDPNIHFNHALFGVLAEAGEVAGKFQKLYRGDFSSVDKEVLAKELGDMVYYITALAHRIGYGLEDVIDLNVKKLDDRANRDKIEGEGDNR